MKITFTTFPGTDSDFDPEEHQSSTDGDLSSNQESNVDEDEVPDTGEHSSSEANASQEDEDCCPALPVHDANANAQAVTVTCYVHGSCMASCNLDVADLGLEVCDRDFGNLYLYS